MSALGFWEISAAIFLGGALLAGLIATLRAHFAKPKPPEPPAALRDGPRIKDEWWTPGDKR